MIEDYEIHIRSHHAEGTGRYEITRNGRRKEITRYVAEYETDAGIFRPAEWKKRALAEIEKQGELETLEEVKAVARKSCAWLHNEREIEEYAISCLCSRAYLHWPEFDTIIWM